MKYIALQWWMMREKSVLRKIIRVIDTATEIVIRQYDVIYGWIQERQKRKKKETYGKKNEIK